MAAVSVLLVVHHTASPALDAMLQAVLDGAGAVPEVEVRSAAALTCSPVEVLGADGLVLGTPANMGYMSGALKVFFDGCYYPVLREKAGLAYGLFVHGNDDTAGAVGSVERLADGLRWKRALPPVAVVGPVERADRERLFELGATLAATIS